MKTTVEINDELYKKIQDKGLKINYIFMRGWNSINEPSNVIELRMECEHLYDNIHKLQEKLTKYSEKYGEID